MLIQSSLVFFLTVALLAAQSEDQTLKSQQAKQLMGNGKFAEAVPLYRDLVRAVPDNPGLLLNLGMALHMSGQDRAAIQQFENALKLEPNTFPALGMMGASYMRLGQPASAIPPLRRAVALQPGNGGVRRMLGDALLAIDRYDESAAQFQQLSILEPQNPYAWHGLGRSFEALARKSFEQLARTAQGSAWWLALIAESRIQHKQNSSAFYFYRQALAKHPALRGAHAAIAAIYRDTGHPEWAQEEDRREQAIGEPDCRTTPAECHLRAGRYAEVLAATRLSKTAEAQYWRVKAYNGLATEAFARLASLGPSVPFHAFQAEVHRSQGRHQDAVGEFQKALALQPADVRLEKEVATTVYLSRDYAAAEPLLRNLLQRQPESADLHFLLGDTLLQLQRLDDAIPSLESAVRRDPQMRAARSALGRALMQTGQPEKAIPHLQAALPIDDDGSLHYQLMRALQTAGKVDLAAQTLRKYQDIQKANESAKKQLEQESQITAPEPR